MVINRFSNAIKVFKTSLSFIKRDKSLIAIPILMLLANLIIAGLFIFDLFLVGFASNTSMVTTLVLLILLGYLVNAFLASAQSWMVYEVAKGKDTSLTSGLKRALKNFKDVLYFSIASFVLAILVDGVRGHKENQSVLSQVVRSSTADTLNFLSKIIKKLTIPAMIVTDMSFGQAVASLKKSVKAIPEILIFEVGIGPITGILTFIFFLLSFWLVWSGAILAGVSLFVISALIIGLLSLLINQIYYTLVYITIIEKKKIKGLNLK